MLMINLWFIPFLKWIIFIDEIMFGGIFLHFHAGRLRETLNFLCDNVSRQSSKHNSSNSFPSKPQASATLNRFFPIFSINSFIDFNLCLQTLSQNLNKTPWFPQSLGFLLLAKEKLVPFLLPSLSASFLYPSLPVATFLLNLSNIHCFCQD